MPTPFDLPAGPVIKKSAVNGVLDTIKALIISRQLKPGDRLPSELELSKILATSRGPIREAIKILSSFGIVEIRRGDGTYVSESMSAHIFDRLLFQMLLSDTDKKKLFELRELFELGIVDLVVANASDKDLAAVEREYQLMAEKIKSKDWDTATLTHLDLSFHSAIAAATGNDLIKRIYDFTLDLFAPSIEETHKHKQKGLNALKLHKRIVDGLMARDKRSAEDAVRESIEQWATLS